MLNFRDNAKRRQWTLCIGEVVSGEKNPWIQRCCSNAVVYVIAVIEHPKYVSYAGLSAG